jgi:hypothetical protein
MTDRPVKTESKQVSTVEILGDINDAVAKILPPEAFSF